MAWTVNIRGSEINQHIILRIQNTRAICGQEPVTDRGAEQMIARLPCSTAAPQALLVSLYIDVRVTAEWLAMTDVYN